MAVGGIVAVGMDIKSRSGRLCACVCVCMRVEGLCVGYVWVGAGWVVGWGL